MCSNCFQRGIEELLIKQKPSDQPPSLTPNVVKEIAQSWYASLSQVYKNCQHLMTTGESVEPSNCNICIKSIQISKQSVMLIYTDSQQVEHRACLEVALVD